MGLGGNVSGAATQARPATKIECLTERLRDIHSMFSENNDRLHGCLNRAHGSAPEGQATQSNPHAVPYGDLYVVNEILDAIEALGKKQMGLSERLATIL